MDTSIVPQNNKKTCIRCGASLYSNSDRCRGRCTKSKKPDRTCADCGTVINSQSTICRPCCFKRRKQKADERKERGLGKKYHCIDCGIVISATRTRCRHCYHKSMQAKEKATRHCVDCGHVVNDHYSVRCRNCYYKTTKSKKPTTYCIDCGAETKHQADRCRKCYGISLRKKPDDYHSLAEQRGFLWVGELPSNTGAKTEWTCGKKHLFKSCYGNIQAGSGCPYCLNMINSVRSSKPQHAIFEMVGGVQNLKVGRYTIDVALQLSLVNIAIEYDCWFWHGNQSEKDNRKTENLMKRGWKVLRIKARNMIPTFDEIQGAIFDLMAGANYREIIMDDWGKGDVKTWSAAGGKVEER